MPRITKIAAITVGAVAALVLGASTASAQTVELEREQGGHCPAVVTVVNHEPTPKDCSIHARTEPGTTWDLYQHTGVSEIPFSGCEWEFEAAFDENGHGYIYNQVLTPEGGTCGREPCDEAEPSHRNIPWEAQISESVPGEEALRMTFCLTVHNPDPASEGTTGTPCTFDLHVNRVEHAYELETGDGINHESPCINLGNVIEIEAHFITTTSTPRHRGFEVHHLN